MTTWTQGALVGLAFGTGLVVVLARLPVLRKVGLDARLAPYLRDAARPSRLLGRSSRSRFSALLGFTDPLSRRAAHRFETLLGGAPSIRRRLSRAGKNPDVESFRAEQVLWGVAGAALGAFVAAVAWLRGSASVVVLVVLVLVAGAFGVAARDWALSQQAGRREIHILAQFPAVAEMLALSVSAGEGPVAALERVSRLSNGELAVELRRTLADARAGASLPMALQALADRTGLVPLARFVDGIIVAVERGTPLADVLRAQAEDVRDAGQRALMDAAGKREIAMMVTDVKRVRFCG